MKKVINKIYLLGYRAEGIKLYRTNIKPLGYVVAGLGFVSLGIAVIPNGLFFVAYPLAFFLLGLVGINTIQYKKRIGYELKLYKLRLFK